MSCHVAVTLSGGDGNAIANSFIITLECLALTWNIRLSPLSIDSWRALHEKFLPKFQGYRPKTDALVELSLCRQQEK